ncbi:MAG: HAMP domain-containing protein [Treponema sp.]|nr:HAMP domain-containing protein [Treponema sp.]
MSFRKGSISTRFSIATIVVIIAVVAVSSITTGIFFARNSLKVYYDNCKTGLAEFSDSISMFFGAKQAELNSFAEMDEVQNADSTIHSFVNEVGTIQILEYKKSPVEAEIRRVCKIFAKNDKDIAEIYIGTKWGGYATNFDSSMSGGYDPRKRGWYATASSGNGKVMITDAFASTVGATVVGITRCAYDKKGEFIGNASIEVSLDTLTKILEVMDFGKDSFVMMVQKDGTILADTSKNKNNFKNIEEINIPGLKKLLSSSQKTGSIQIEGQTFFTEYITNPMTDYQIVVFCPESTVLAAFKHTLYTTILVCAIFGFFIALVIALITRKIMKPLRDIRDGISETAEQIASGNANLKKRLEIKSNNEIGDVASSFNVFSDKLEAIIMSMKSSKSSLNDAGEKLSNATSDAMASIEQISGSIKILCENLNKQNSSVEQTSENVTKILESISSLEKLVSVQAQSVEEASAAVEQMIGNIGEVTSSVDKMAVSFGNLEADAENGAKTQKALQTQISEIENQSKLLSEANAVIANIANQTNLLAMNAAIEAAHAGEAGKGFAVVADEIRKLSETSSGQSKTIGEQLTSIQTTIDSVVQATQKGVQGYAHLASEIEETDEIVRQIKAAMTEQQSGSVQITDALSRLNDSTNSVQKASREMASESRAIVGEVSSLHQETGTMKQSMDEMEISASKINAAGGALSEISALMENSIGEIGKQVDQFKL